MKNKILSCRMEKELIDALEIIAEDDDRSLSYIVRQAIIEYLQKRNIKIERPEKEIYKIPNELINR
jgi:predicted transcriptional regulator